MILTLTSRASRFGVAFYVTRYGWRDYFFIRSAGLIAAGLGPLQGEVFWGVLS